MHLEQITYKIFTVRTAVFKGNYSNAGEISVELLSLLMKEETFAATLPPIARDMLRALEDKDYLLLADVIYFELPKLWNGTRADIDEVLHPKFTVS